MIRARTTGLVAALCLVLLGCGSRASAPGSQRPASTGRQWKGPTCGISKFTKMVIKTEGRWEHLWKEMGQPAPKVDFNRNLAVAVFLGTKMTGGYGIDFKRPGRGDSGELVIRYTISEPKGFVVQMLTQPYAIKLFARHFGVVTISELK